MDNMSNGNFNQMQGKTKKGIAVLVGILGVLLSAVTMFLPFAKAGKKSISLIGIAKVYLTTGEATWGSKTYADFYKIFIPVMLALMILFALIYLVKCIKKKPVGMIIATILEIAVYEVLKWDFKDRGVVPGNCEKGIAFAIIYLCYVALIAGVILCIIEKKKK